MILVNRPGRALAQHQAIATGIAKMNRLTFQIGSGFATEQLKDSSFRRSLERLSDALAPKPAPVRTRFEQRFASIAGAA